MSGFIYFCITHNSIAMSNTTEKTDSTQENPLEVKLYPKGFIYETLKGCNQHMLRDIIKEVVSKREKPIGKGQVTQSELDEILSHYR